MPNYTITLDQENVNNVLAALGKCPYDQVHVTITLILTQCKNQPETAEQEAEPETVD